STCIIPPEPFRNPVAPILAATAVCGVGMMNIRAKIFGGQQDENPVVAAKKPKGAKADTLNSIAVAREEARRSDTRDGDRHRLPDEQVTVTHNGENHAVQLVNLSGGGAMVSGGFEPMLWDQVELHLGENGTIECAVRWIKGDRIGLEFAHETRLDCSAGERANVLRAVIAKSFPDVEIEAPIAAAQPAPPSGNEHRGGRRHPLIWSGVLHHDFQSTPCRLRNLSETGAMIECSVALRIGAEPLLELGEEVHLGTTVAWVAGDTAGLRFSEPFDLAELASSRPEVASARWEAPSYLKPGIAAAESPWDEQWDRMSLGELRQSLEGYLKR
ncbi:MAG TPA: PilZ domain-containing protein, partial [Sphingomicrobium sp.]